MWWQWLTWWQWLLSAVVSIAFGWAVKRVLDKGWDSWQKRRAKKRLAEGEHIDPPKGRFTSHFAQTPNEVEAVLRLRRAFFGSKVIVPDEVYRAYWRRNPYTMKLVYYLGEPIGYWSVIPIEAATFEKFIRGQSSHGEMLTEHCLDWPSVNPDAAYLYIVGAVVPIRDSLQDVKQSLLQGELSGRVMLDLCCFGQDILEHITVKGVCGYPSRTGGYRLFKNMEKKAGFEELKILIDQEKSQPVFALTETRVSQFRNHLASRLKKSKRKTPLWEAHDRRRFLHMLRKLRKGPNAL